MAATSRPFVSVQFTCCNTYQRIYANRARTAYVGWCPRCTRQVKLLIGPGGTSARSFRAS